MKMLYLVALVTLTAVIMINKHHSDQLEQQLEAVRKEKIEWSQRCSKIQLDYESLYLQCRLRGGDANEKSCDP